MRLRISAPLAVAALLLAAGLAAADHRVPTRAATAPTSAAGAPTSTARPCTGAARPARWHHVIWVWMENHALRQVIGSPHAPYLTSLAGRCGLATDYHGIRYPSLPNYLAATSGSTHGVTDDGPPSAHPIAGPSIFSQVPGWRSLQEAMPVSCDLTDAYPYMVKHNPAAYYTSIRAQCRRQDVPLTGRPSFAAPFTFVTPDMCADTHDCPTASGDAWLAKFVPKVLSSPQYAHGDTLLVVTFDTDDHSAGNRVATVLVAPSISAGTRSGTHYTHYSLLRTTEELLGKPPLGAAASAASMRRGFGL